MRLHPEGIRNGKFVARFLNPSQYPGYNLERGNQEFLRRIFLEQEPDYKLGMLPSSPLGKRKELHREQLEEFVPNSVRDP